MKDRRSFSSFHKNSLHSEEPAEGRRLEEWAACAALVSYPSRHKAHSNKYALLLRMKRLVVLCVAALIVVSVSLHSIPAFAVEPDEILDDPVLEARAREISRELRCVTCQSQSIDDSHADLAKDFRLVVRERLLAGDSDAEVVAYVTDRYGDYVRLKPEMRSDTALLWLTPWLALAGAGGVALIYFRKLQKNPVALEDDDEDGEIEEETKKETGT